MIGEGELVFDTPEAAFETVKADAYEGPLCRDAVDVLCEDCFVKLNDRIGRMIRGVQE